MQYHIVNSTYYQLESDIPNILGVSNINVTDFLKIMLFVVYRL